MSAPVLDAATTTDDLLAFPSDGVDRWLVRGQLRERPMTVRNRFHSRIMSRISQLLNNWLDAQPAPRGQILGGEAGVRIRRDPDTTVGIDVVYISAESAAKQSDETTLIDGVPVLVVEILSPSDTIEEIDEMIDEYLGAGVPLVWIVDPHDRSILVHRPDAEPRLYTQGTEIVGEPLLPGLRLPIARVFE